MQLPRNQNQSSGGRPRLRNFCPCLIYTHAFKLIFIIYYDYFKQKSNRLVCQVIYKLTFCGYQLHSPFMDKCEGVGK